MLSYPFFWYGEQSSKDQETIYKIVNIILAIIIFIVDSDVLSIKEKLSKGWAVDLVLGVLILGSH